MATFKVTILRDNKKRNGSMPVAVRLTHNRATKYIPTPYVAFPQQLDRNGEPKEPNLRMRVNDTYNGVKAILDELGFRVKAYTPDELKDYVAKRLHGAGGGTVDFFEFAEGYVKKIRPLQKETARSHDTALNNLARYLGGRRLPITELTSNFFYKYNEWMRKAGGMPKVNKKTGVSAAQPLGERGQSLYLGNIRTIFNVAAWEYNDYDKGDIPIPNRPFERFKVLKARPLKTAEQKALSVAHIKAIRDYTPRGRRDELARDCFMLSFYLCGMNSVDLFQCDILKDNDVVNERYKGQKSVSYDELEAAVRASIIPLEKISTSSYSSYGLDNLNKDRTTDEDYTLILNFPNVEHGKTGHFSGDFESKNRRDINYTPKQLDSNTWVAVEESYQENANENNIYQYVGTAGSKEAVEQWISDFEKKMAHSPVNKGMFGHIRVWKDEGMTYIAELQSDYFQKNTAKKDFVENSEEYKQARKNHISEAKTYLWLTS